MPSPPTSPPSCCEDPPWSFCGDRDSADFGLVFARPGASGAAVLTFDRDGRHHAMTVFDGRKVGAEVVIFGRRFAVRQAPG